MAVLKPADIRAFARVMADMGITELVVGDVTIRKPLVLGATKASGKKKQKLDLKARMDEDDGFKDFDEGLVRR